MNRKLVNLPSRQGLYDPQFEKDACGMGFVASIKGVKSHDVISKALNLLENMEHRGGQGSEPNTGDGAGILIQIPHQFYSSEWKKQNIELPEPEQYAVGMMFMPQDAASRQEIEAVLAQIIEEEGQELIGFREVPTNDNGLGQSALSVKPYVAQVFIRRNANLTDTMAFERKLYVIRKRAELAVRYGEQSGGEMFYFSSMSSRKIVYKGMLTTEQVRSFYIELNNPEVVSAMAMVHSRFSTNTFPSWERAHPFHYMIHNGEINTLRGNVNWMHARQTLLASELFGDDLEKIMPIIAPDGSDTAMFDNTFEFLHLAGRSLAHVAMMMVPEPWSNHKEMDSSRKAFYEYHSTLMEPWDGPAAMGFTDGLQIGAMLDRNGLRPARYYVTKDEHIILGSEAGAVPIEPEEVLYKDRLRPGRMLLIDTVKGCIVPDEEIKAMIAEEHPYRQWLNEHLVDLNDLPDAPLLPEVRPESLQQRQQAFGFTYEEIQRIIEPMAISGQEPLSSMGYDAPLAVLSERPQRLYSYFKQLFAQVTNPPIDAIREELITSTVTTIGPERNLLMPEPESCRHVKLATPILSNEQFAKLRHIRREGFKAMTLPIFFASGSGEKGLEQALDEMFEAADRIIAKGHNLIILSDRGLDKDNTAIPALLAVSALHHHLIRNGNRTKVSILLESGEPREVHHFALLLGYGANVINPYLVFETLEAHIDKGTLRGLSYYKAVNNYIKAATKGVVKVLSKMGISTIQSYRGAQIFEAVGLEESLIEKYFTWTPSRIGGIHLTQIAKDAQAAHDLGFSANEGADRVLDSGGEYQWRREGEEHLLTPQTIHTLQQAARKNDYKLYKKFSTLIQGENKKHLMLRSLLDFKKDAPSVPLEEVESVSSIVKRFKTGAMSFGSISQEAHESLAIAMNRLGGRSNTGEGGEHPSRFQPDENGDLRRSSIKQVASGRFGVTSQYLTNADEIQIKMAQGAKPGEGGQLPGQKVYPWVAEVRGSTPGVGLISPPPHHDIYSIEDLAELIHDLKNANPAARISVKLVAGSGVGTIAAGVAKARADVITISGYDGGTGASPIGSIRHAGLPWELGLSETHQTLMLNQLRDRVVLETDGKLMNGRDVAIAALLGAEEFGFSTAPLIVLGCVMMRVCQLDTCPVGVATQNPELRKNFTGDPQHIVNYLTFIAEELREWMAELGFRTVEEMVGRVDRLQTRELNEHLKAKGIDLSAILYNQEPAEGSTRYQSKLQNHGLELSLDARELIPNAKAALESKQQVRGTYPIKNTDRVVGTTLGYEVTKRYGGEGLPEDTIWYHFVGTAGQSFGAFVPQGITLSVEGDTNDYFGKGLSGGKLIVAPSEKSTFAAESNVVTGNTVLYGATSGEAYIRGIAGERFAVRNSGVRVVVEGVGDHGCEYMTGGRVVILGETGRNFGAGMSGGVAYVYDPDRKLIERSNLEMILLEHMEEQEDINELQMMLKNHVQYTGSTVASRILLHFADELDNFVKVIPKDYKKMLQHIKSAQQAGHDQQDALLIAFESSKKEALLTTAK
ncbi:glutamate synthase large subunit [Paenibacillus sp. FSL W7-1287]|uniref:glutamate synthase large subunit n=1 Tax=Paenibacillus sp. FSL W7-1287 TaxID=2954538 RepID=UPI0030F87150